MFMFQAWLERNQEKFGSRQVIIQNIWLLAFISILSSGQVWICGVHRSWDCGASLQARRCRGAPSFWGADSGLIVEMGFLWIKIMMCQFHLLNLCRCAWRGWMVCLHSFTAAEPGSLRRLESSLFRTPAGQVLLKDLSEVILYLYPSWQPCQGLVCSTLSCVIFKGLTLQGWVSA